MSKKKKAEIQNDWISRLENPEQSWIHSMAEFEALYLRQPQTKNQRQSSEYTKYDKVVQNILNGGTIQGLHSHTHTNEQLAFLNNNRELRVKHVKDDHFGGNAILHDSYHN